MKLNSIKGSNIIYNEISLHTNQNGYLEKNPQTINTGESVERREHSYTVDGNVKWYSH